MTMTVAGMNEPPLVKVRVLRAKFMADGKLAEVGAVVSLPIGDAHRLAAIGHAELCDSKR